MAVCRFSSGSFEATRVARGIAEFRLLQEPSEPAVLPQRPLLIDEQCVGADPLRERLRERAGESRESAAKVTVDFR